MRLGAFDFIRKQQLPFTLKVVIDSALKAQSDMKAATSAKPALPVEEHQDSPVGKSAAMQQVFKMVGRVSMSDAPVMITGESGSGKELVARAVHQYSQRHNKSYVAINCAAIPDNLLESTLFGYEKGAFTGAAKSQPGKFEQAEGGTLFLDEIGEMPKELQAKLLRVLQDRLVERLGGSRPLKCDVRIISATNQDLARQVKQGAFREDLFFRLAVITVPIPPLRDRAGDVMPLAEMMLEKYGRTMGRTHLRLSAEAEHTLRAYSWPGNVRELENTIQRALLIAEGPSISAADLELEPPGDGTFLASNLGAGMESAPAALDVATVEREHILRVLGQVDGNRRKAAEILGLSERGLRYKLKAYSDAGFFKD